MSKSKRQRREDFGLGEKVVYGRANPFAPQDQNNVDTDPRTAASFNAQAPAFNGQMGAMGNPYGDGAISTPAMFTPGANGGIAPFSGNMQKDVPGQGLNQIPGAFLPSIDQRGSSDAADRQEGGRLGEEALKRGLFATNLGPSNPGMQPAPGGSTPANIQTPSTLPLMGAQGGIVQANKDGRRGSRSKERGMFT